MLEFVTPGSIYCMKMKMNKKNRILKGMDTVNSLLHPNNVLKIDVIVIIIFILSISPSTCKKKKSILKHNKACAWVNGIVTAQRLRLKKKVGVELPAIHLFIYLFIVST